jgi:hypothetical protein
MSPILAPENTPADGIRPRPHPAETILSRPRRRRADDYYFVAMCLVILGTVYLGFARSYYQAGTLHAPLPSIVIHVHAVVFSAWVLLLIVQTTLVSIGRVNWHKKVGILGAGLACLVVVMGVLGILDSTRRHFAPPGLSAGQFLAVDLLEMVVFAFLVIWGLRLRRDGPAHKRLFLLANISLLSAPIGRWPFYFISHFPPSISLVIAAFLLSLMTFDLASRRRIHRVTVLGSLAILLTAPVAFGPLAHLPIWLQFTAWVQR